ncbi:hypothetical protein ACP275_10G174800 [Erythranthe tilingii]
MLELLFTAAFAAAPLILYIPPIRSLNLFVEAMELLLLDAVSYVFSIFPRLPLAASRP